jgi:RNA polymerase primary sigma factor/RNA polymerase sigma factor
MTSRGTDRPRCQREHKEHNPFEIAEEQNIMPATLRRSRSKRGALLPRRNSKKPMKLKRQPAQRSTAHQAQLQAQQARAARAMDWPLDYIKSREFTAPNAAKGVLGPMPQPASPARKAKAPAGLPPYLASLYEVPLLSREQEQHLFRRYNFLKHRVSKMRSRLDPSQPDARLLDEMEELYRQAVETKNQIIRANLRLVVSIAKKYISDLDGLFDLISDGNMSLLKAVEKFDYSLGFKFSTYATWAIRKNYVREYVTRVRHVDRFHTSQDEVLESAADDRSDGYRQEIEQQQRQSQVDQMLGCLSPRELDIIVQRYGLNGCPRAHTLKEVGERLGISKERVRQLATRALGKLREASESLPGGAELFEQNTSGAASEHSVDAMSTAA